MILKHTFELADPEAITIQFQVIVPYKSDVQFVDQNDEIVKVAAEKKAVAAVTQKLGPVFAEICGQLTVLDKTDVYADEVEVFIETELKKPATHISETSSLVPYGGA